MYWVIKMRIYTQKKQHKDRHGKLTKKKKQLQKAQNLTGGGGANIFSVNNKGEQN